MVHQRGRISEDEVVVLAGYFRLLTQVERCPTTAAEERAASVHGQGWPEAISKLPPVADASGTQLLCARCSHGRTISRDTNACYRSYARHLGRSSS